MTDCIKIYKNYFNLGWRERFGLSPSDIYDEFMATLPKGAELIGVGIGNTPAIKLADGEICTELYTQHYKDGNPRPYLMAGVFSQPYRIYLDICPADESRKDANQ